MSSYGLIKITSKIQRADTITDLRRLNQAFNDSNVTPITPYGSSVRAIENTVALGIQRNKGIALPEFVRGLSFYQGVIPEITPTEIKQFNRLNKQS